jgi:hypothetical protein
MIPRQMFPTLGLCARCAKPVDVPDKALCSACAAWWESVRWRGRPDNDFAKANDAWWEEKKSKCDT